MLQSENSDAFYIRYYKPFQAVDPASWQLSVEGLVNRPATLNLQQLQSLPRVTQTSRMKCVECWSAPAKWEGFRIDSLMPQVEPQPDARWVHFFSADGYYESLSLDELRMDRVLFVYRMNDQPLSDPHGAPLRLIAPFKYGYKGPKAITRLVLAKEQLVGYWAAVGRYGVEGNIEAGFDSPLDLGGSRPIQGGEVRYPDGIEARG